MAPRPHFTKALFSYLRDLERNNDRAWFKAHKSRYEEVLREPALTFIAELGPHLQQLSAHFVADPRPVGGSLFRIHRDTRFSKDKTPYKTSVGIHFRHESAKDAHAPGYYLHLGNDGCFFAMGLWMPETKVAYRIRHAIAEDPKGWKKATRGKAFSSTFELGGDKLKRPPRGFDKEHPLVEDLKRKSFMGSTPLTKKQVTSPGLDREIAKLGKKGKAFMGFLCKALDVPF